MKFPALVLPAVRAAVCLLACAGTARAQVARFRTLHAFAADNRDTNTEGERPQAGLLVGLDGNYYGTAFVGGANGNGTVFQVTPAGTLTVLHTFSALNADDTTNDDGTTPQAPLIQDDAGNLYGTTYEGGAHGDGTVFMVTPGGGFTTLYSLGSGSNFADGAFPSGSLIFTPDGFLAGTSENGGDASSDGTLFFTAGTDLVAALDLGGSLGAIPSGALALDRLGVLYGTCQAGGNGSGTVYGEANGASSGGAFLVYAFSAVDDNVMNADGAGPQGGVIVGRDGNLYGTASEGGPNGKGTVWQLVFDPNGVTGTLHVLHPFAGSDGAGPHAAVVQGSDGSFYGTAVLGGAGGGGVVFRVTAGKMYTVLHAFSGGNDGMVPVGGLVEVRPGSFVGTATQGGVNGTGTIFEVDVAPVITSAATATGNAGSAFSYQITAADNPGSYSVGGLGDGLQFNAATGLISGTPTAAETLKLTVGASNDVGTGSKAVTVTIKEAIPVITSPGTATAQVGVAFSYQIAASCEPISYGVGGLRPGLSVNKTTGLITGTPTGAGTFTLTLQAANAGGTGTKPLTFIIKPAKPAITSNGTANAVVGQPFSYQIAATGSPMTYGVGGLIAGFSVNKQTGLVSGTPTAAEVGTHTLTLQAANAGGTGSKPLTLTVATK